MSATQNTGNEFTEVSFARFSFNRLWRLKSFYLSAFMDETFGKAYKLCSQKAIAAIFEQKKSVKQFPFVLHFAPMELPTDKSFQVVISAPKRIFRKAHDRNRIKRLMKEVFRKNKLILEEKLTTNQQQMALFLVYTNKEEMEYTLLLRKMESLLLKFTNEI